MLDQNIQVNLIPYKQCDEQIGTYVLSDRSIFDKHIDELCETICSEEDIKYQYEMFVDSKKDEYMYIFNNHQNRLLRRLANKGFLPNKIISKFLPQNLYQDKEKLLTLLSYFQCESHDDIMTLLLNKFKKEK
jgi:hypothetical protein